MAQHQGRKRKGDSAHDQLARDDVPTHSIKLPEKSDLPNTLQTWNKVQLPVDILLMTVEDCEFLACYTFLRNSFKSYHKSLGYVYFGTMGESGDVPLRVALMTCSEGSSAPGGSLVAVKNVVVELRPKAVFSVGCLEGLNPEVTKLQLGDVVVSSKLLTDGFKTPVGRDIFPLIRHANDGWIPPLRSPEDHKVQVCCDGEILTGTDPINAKRQCMSDSIKAVAFEKGGGGLFAAAHDVNIEWVIVKGISHFSDDSNTPNESWKSFASIMAASLVSNMLNDPVVFKEWPHYEDVSANKASSTLPDLSMKKQPTSEPKKKLPDSVCLEKCQKRLKMIYSAKNKVRIIPWDQSSAVDIDEMYTQLTWLKDHRRPSGVTQNELGSYTEIFNGGKRLLVYGRPGIGKTVFTKKAAFDWSLQRYQETIGAFELVLLIRLRDVCNLHDVPSIFKASQLLANDGKISVDDLYDYVLNHQEKVLLILDGYDEYSAGEQSPVDEIWKRNQLSDCCVIVTSRQMTTDKLREPSDAQFEINGFDDERQREFARRFLKDEDDVRKFCLYLLEQHLKDLAEIPLLLLILCLLWKEKDHKELPKKRVEIFNQFVKTLFHHMHGKQSAKSVFNIEDYSDELYALGRLAFEALMNDRLYFPRSELPSYDLIERLIEVGLFQVLNMSSLNPEKGVYFIHKSLQEYLAASFLKEELISKNNESTNSLSKLDTVEKILKMNEVLKFAIELSEEAAREIVIHLKKMAASEEELTKYTFDSEAPSQKDFSEDQRNFLTLCTQLFFYCSAETKRNLFPTFLFSFRGVLLINADQLNDLVKENLVKTTVNVNYVFFTDNEKYTEQDYNNLTILSEQLKAIIVSCTGEKKASEFLSNFTWRQVEEFFLKKEENGTHLYFMKLVKSENRDSLPLPCKMIKSLISKQETTKKTNMNCDESSEESSSSCCSKRHGLSRVRRIQARWVNRSEVELISEMMQFITAPHEIWVWGDPHLILVVWGEYGEVIDGELTESLLRSIQPTHKLERLILLNINLTSSPAVEFINRVFKQDLPNLKWLNMSFNPLLGAGVDSLIKHLSCAPHLETLCLYQVKMTPQQVKDLPTAVQQHSNIPKLYSDYHDHFSGEPLPEHDWPSDDEQSEDDQEQDDSSAEPDDEEERDEEEMIEYEDERSSSEPEDNQEQTRNGERRPEDEWSSEDDWKEWHHEPFSDSSESEDEQEQMDHRLKDDSPAESDNEEEENEEGIMESEDERSSSEEDNQEQNLNLRGEPLPEDDWPSDDYWEDEFPDLFPDSSSESEDDQEQDDSLAEHDDEEERVKEEMIEYEDERSSSEPEDNQEQILAETHPSVHGSPFVAHDPDTVGTFPVPPDPAAGLVFAAALSPAVHGSNHGQTSFSGYLAPHVDPQHHSSPDIHTHNHNTPSTTFTSAGSWGSDLYLQDEPLLELSVGEILAELQLDTRPSTQDALLHDLSGAVGPVPVPFDPAADPMLTGASITTAHGSVHGLAAVEAFSENPVHIQYPQHYSSPVIQSHHHSTSSTIFTPGRSLDSDPYLVGDPGLSTLTQSEPNLGSLPVDEILAELQLGARPITRDVLLQDPGAVGSVPVPLDPAVSAPVSTAHDFNHSLAPSVEGPLLQGMSDPSLYGL